MVTNYMVEREFWKLRFTGARQTNIGELSRLLKKDSFSAIVDTSFKLAIQRLAKKDEIRRKMQADIAAFKFIPTDFVWSNK